MSGEFLQAQTTQKPSETDSGLSGVIKGRVIANCDKKHQGRVQVRLAVRGGIELWARIALFDSGGYFIPKVGTEVLVAFNQGDGNDAYVMGGLWNERNPPPRSESGDPDNQRVISTPAGHEIAFDEKNQSVVIKTANGQQIEMKPEGIKIAFDNLNTSSINLDKNGNITITANADLILKAANIKLDGTKSVTINGNSGVTINGGSNCKIDAGIINIG
jgi:phage baseplate assembly protein V